MRSSNPCWVPWCLRRLVLLQMLFDFGDPMSAMGAEVSTRDASTNQAPQALTKQHGDWLVRISSQWLHKQGCTKDCPQLSGFSRHGRSLRISASFCRCHGMATSAKDVCGLLRSNISIRSERGVLQNSRSVIQASIRMRPISGMPRAVPYIHAAMQGWCDSPSSL